MIKDYPLPVILQRNQDLEKQNNDQSMEIIYLKQQNQEKDLLIQQAAQQKFDDDQKVFQQETEIDNLQQLVQEQSDHIVHLNKKLIELQQKVQQQNDAIEGLQKLVEEKSEDKVLLEQKIIELRKNLENLINKERYNENSLSRLHSDGEQQEINIWPQPQPKVRSNVIYQEVLIHAQLFIGTIEICFLIDTTESMFKNKQFIQQAVKQLNEKLEQQQNKVIKYAVVTYQDYEEYHLQKPYPQIDFNEDIKKILEFISDLQFQGGNDFAEDLQNGLNQALQLNWQSMNKIIMILTDAPCHGKKYNQDVSDNFPEKDIIIQLDQIIEQKINLMCIGFKNENDLTRYMYKEFKKYMFQKEYINIQTYTVDINQQQNKIIDFIQFALKGVQDIEQNNNQPQQSSILKSKSDHLVLQYIFEVYTCDLDIQKLYLYFDNNQQQQLVFKSDLYLFLERGQFDFCEREYQPFYQDSTKKIFKMLYQKNNGQVDFYAITSSIDGPFKSKFEAAQFIKSHLITKVLFQKFKQQLRDFENFNFNFSHYILLKEKNKNYDDKGENYWIAQKFYENGQLYQFNDSKGNITSQVDSNYNDIIQSFSFFSYYESTCKLLICDLKIYKDILLHPKINTSSGQYGKDDNGKNAIYNFLYQFSNFKKQYKYLDYLNIKYN